MVSKKLFLFLVFWKLFLKVGAKHVKYKNYYLKTSFKFNFLKIVFILIWKQKQKFSYQSGPQILIFKLHSQLSKARNPISK